MVIVIMRKGRMSDEKRPERKKWNPQCPLCQEELKRTLELSRIVFEDMDHGAGIYRTELYCTHEAINRKEIGEEKMEEKKEKEKIEDVQHWTAPAYIDPKLAEGPPVGAIIDRDAVCRDCMTASEEITMRRGFIDPISPRLAQEKEFICVRCGKKIG